MGQHFLLHRDLVAATAVHHAVYAFLTNDYQSDLVVIGPQYLRIYRIEPSTSASTAAPAVDAEAEADAAAVVSPGQILHLLASFSLAGVVDSVNVLHFDARLLRKKHRFHGGSDVLLLTVALYKWVIVGFDRQTRQLATLAMYSFAEDAMGPSATLKGERRGRDQLLGLSARSIARVDPQTRCGAMLIYDDQLVIVPFRSSSMELSFFEEDDEGEDEEEDGEEDEDEDEGNDGKEHGNGHGKDKENGHSKRRSKSHHRKHREAGDSDPTHTDEEDEDDEEERKLEALVHETQQSGGMTTEVSKRLQHLLDKSVKVGVKRKRASRHLTGLLCQELTGREFLLRLREMDIRGKVVDLAFLDGYLEPTLMILHEENERSATDGRFAGGNDTFCLTVLSINLNTRLHPRIWTVKNLPSTCFRIIPCRTPVGGVIVLAAHAILYFNQTQFVGLATNKWAEITVNPTIFPLQDALVENEDGQETNLQTRLANCEVTHLGVTELLLASPEGEAFVLSLPFDAPVQSHAQNAAHASNGTVSRSLILKLRRLTVDTAASCMTADATRKTLFVGSRSGDSVLYKYTDTAMDIAGDAADAENKHIDGKMDIDSSAEPEDEEDEDDLYLYGGSPATNGTSSETSSAQTNGHDGSVPNQSVLDRAAASCRYRYELEMLDVLPGVGQLTSVDIGIERNPDSDEQREQLVVGGGYRESGSVSVLHHGLRPIVGTDEALRGCRAMWTVSSALPTTSEAALEHPNEIYHAYLILSVAKRTLVLRTGEGMEPVEDGSGFYTSGPTLAAANLFGRQRIVQIFKEGARVMMEVPVERPQDETKDPAIKEEKEGDATATEKAVKEENTDASQESEGNEEDEEEDEGPTVHLVCTQELTLEGDVESGGMNVDTSTTSIVSVDVIDPFILLLLTDGTIRLLMGDAEDLELTVLDAETLNQAPTQNESGKGDQTEAPASGDLRICAACLFYDWAGMFDDQIEESHTDGEGANNHVKRPRSEPQPKDGGTDTTSNDDDDDDEIEGLYSSRARQQATAATGLEADQHPATGAQNDSSVSISLRRARDAKMMCAVCFDDGSLHVYSLPDMHKRGVFPYLTFAPQRLVNTLTSRARAPALGLNAVKAVSNDGRIRKSRTMNSPVADMVIQRVGPSETQRNAQHLARMVLLLFLANGDLVLYAALPQPIAPGKPCCLTFMRVDSDLITRPFLPLRAAKAGSSSQETPDVDTAAVLAKLRAGFRYPMLTRFSNVNNNSGVFFRGAHPMWVLSARGLPTFVPMSVSRPPPTANSAVSIPVLSFAPFHHWNCPHGFIYFHSSGALRVCELPSSKTSTLLPASGGFVLHKIPIGATVHNLFYMGSHGPGGVAEALQMPTYAIVCSRAMRPEQAELSTQHEYDEEDEDAEPEEIMVDSTSFTNTSNVMAPTAELLPDWQTDDLVAASEDVYELRVIQTTELGDWDRRGVFRVFFERFEAVLSVQIMYLADSSLLRDDVSSRSLEWQRKRKPFVVIGTGFVSPHGEDESGKGRLLLYELDYAQYASEDGTSSVKLPKLRLLFIKQNYQGSITCVTQLGPYVLAAVGMKLIVYEFRSDQLIGCAFYDTQTYIVSIRVVKDFVMYGDVYQSVHLLRWKEKQRQLVLLAKDYEPLTVTATEFSLLEQHMGMLATDTEENLHVLQYAPRDIESRGGQRLLRTSDFHVGQQVTSILRKRVDLGGAVASGHQNGHQNQRRSAVYVNLMGTSEGGVSAVIPVSERVFRRLFTLQSLMINTLPQICALNPREFRTVKSADLRRTGRPDAWCKQMWKKGFLDAQVLLRFVQLDYVAQRELARGIGTTPEVIVHNLLEAQLLATTGL